MNTYLEQLNEPQRAAVLQKDGPMIIIAGAGSGKTRVLTYRIAHMMQQGVDSFNILSLTFTNKAAREMKERIAGVVGHSEAKNLWMGTFHSVFARILRSEADRLGYPSNFTIYDSQDSVRLITTIIREMKLDKDRYKPKQILSRISSFKNSLITVRAYFNNSDLQQADLEASRPRVGDIYKAYVDRCFKSGAMDFDDLLLRTNELLTRFPEVLAKYQDRFRYIMVDEYQDTNHSQYLIVRALADRFQNICVVGDDSQSIYSFRGANINNILNFQKDYPDVKTFKLEQNYRSTGNIVEAANSVIDKNKTKLDKEVWTANDAGESIKIMRTISDGEEGRFVAQSIWENQINNQLTSDSFAILYRTNAQSRAIEDALRKKDIKYKIYGGISFYQRKEIKDLLSYLRMLINPNDEEALKRIINYPARGIGATTVDKLAIAANHYKKSIFEILLNLDKVDIKINSGTKNKLENFVRMIQRFQIEAQKMNAFEVADLVVKQTQLVKDLQKDGTPEGVNKVENVQELLNGVKDFITDKIETGEDASLTSFLEDVALATDFDSEKDDTPCVSLMTIHLSKGLEYPYVYIVGLEESLFPSAMSMNTRSELEEERRLFYVALTRAEKVAYLTYAQTRYRWGKLTDGEPSRFLEEIDDKFVEHLAPKAPEPSANRFIDASLFDDTPNKIRFQKPIQKKRKEFLSKKEKPNLVPPKSKMKKVSEVNSKMNLFDGEIVVGNFVEHNRFGAGEVIALEGKGPNKKAEIKFGTVGKKKLLLQFAKLKVIG
ncbi:MULTISPECIES: ATP-dependent helicase [unclassified Tenacibaculum]|uniref:ATP-dependent helicase n=1 Tax=unclassified Tenacibaculum TaxID=2635139 RepID=UPI001F32AC5D|nr:MULTISPECIES: UvrD-helicase domain-containing protein [unclassified Tenacibaculum]MCF2873906.1 UvrD-helicase domain-containing protein [Tenacibaculum sp. Cn5-1]MCF2936716.1 UvrD-helicase domain-containing protein [Tenacibaculum sp. Cn5-34]MCG7512940.1 UvrD-helicase domain-containing protein [Tenacibaculum sp. Cn5-46]